MGGKWCHRMSGVVYDPERQDGTEALVGCTSGDCANWNVYMKMCNDAVMPYIASKQVEQAESKTKMMKFKKN